MRTHLPILRWTLGREVFILRVLSEQGENKMDEEQAAAIAEALGGEPWQSGGDIWLVLVHRRDGHLVVISDEVVCEYESQEAFDSSNAIAAINLVT
jgi:hypothetical protein